MSLLLSVLPAAWRPYAKTVLAVIGAVAATLTVALPSVPSWWTVVVSALTALGVYAQPNATPSLPTGDVTPTV